MAHKIALDPNNVQATYFARASGVTRFAYNWARAVPMDAGSHQGRSGEVEGHHPATDFSITF